MFTLVAAKDYIPSGGRPQQEEACEWGSKRNILREAVASMQQHSFVAKMRIELVLLCTTPSSPLPFVPTPAPNHVDK